MDTSNQEIRRLERENERLRFLLKLSESLIDLIQKNQDQQFEHINRINNHLDRSNGLLMKAIEAKDGQLLTTFTRAYHLLHRN